MTKTHAIAATLAAVLLASPAVGNEFEPQLRAMAADDIMTWITDPVVIAALRAQNASNGGLSETEIVARDDAWRAEVSSGDQPTIAPVLEGAAAEFLRGRRDASGGLYTEIFVMDMVGLNVAASDITSDFWQGDEAKWQQTYGAGAGAIHISEIELDESTQTYQSQVSLTITDPDSGDAIGAVTVGVNVGLIF